MTNASAHNQRGAASETTAALSLRDLLFDEYGQAPIPVFLRPEIEAIVEALASNAPTQNLKKATSAHFIHSDISISLQNIAAYPTKNVFVDEASWQTSVITEEGRCLIDLSTPHESPSDLVLHLDYVPNEGINIGLVYVP